MCCCGPIGMPPAPPTIWQTAVPGAIAPGGIAVGAAQLGCHDQQRCQVPLGRTGDWSQKNLLPALSQFENGFPG